MAPKNKNKKKDTEPKFATVRGGGGLWPADSRAKWVEDPQESTREKMWAEYSSDDDDDDEPLTLTDEAMSRNPEDAPVTSIVPEEDSEAASKAPKPRPSTSAKHTGPAATGLSNKMRTTASSSAVDTEAAALPAAKVAAPITSNAPASAREETATEPPSTQQSSNNKGKQAFLRAAIPTLPARNAATNPDTREYCGHASFVAHCVNCEAVDALKVYNKEVAIQAELEEQLKTLNKAVGSDATQADKDLYNEIHKKHGKMDGRIEALASRFKRLRQERDGLKEVSKSNPDVWNDAVNKNVRAKILARQKATGKLQSSGLPREFVAATQASETSTKGALDRTTIPATADFVLDMASGFHMVNGTRSFNPKRAVGTQDTHGRPAMMAYGSTFQDEILGVPRLRAIKAKGLNDIQIEDDPWADDSDDERIDDKPLAQGPHTVSEASLRVISNKQYGTENPALSDLDQSALFEAGRLTEAEWLTEIYAAQSKRLRQFEDSSDDAEEKDAQKLRSFGGLASWLSQSQKNAGGIDAFNEHVQRVKANSDVDPQDLKTSLAEYFKSHKPTRDKYPKNEQRPAPTDHFLKGEYPGTYSRTPFEQDAALWQEWSKQIQGMDFNSRHRFEDWKKTRMGKR